MQILKWLCLITCIFTVVLQVIFQIKTINYDSLYVPGLLAYLLTLSDVIIGTLSFILLIITLVRINKLCAQLSNSDNQIDSKGYLLQQTIKFNRFLGIIHAVWVLGSSIMIFQTIYDVTKILARTQQDSVCSSDCKRYSIYLTASSSFEGFLDLLICLVIYKVALAPKSNERILVDKTTQKVYVVRDVIKCVAGGGSVESQILVEDADEMFL